MLFAERIPWFHSNESVPEIAVQRGAFAATLKVATSQFCPEFWTVLLSSSLLLRNNSPSKVSKLVLGEVKEVEVGVVNTHLATWYSETEAKWSQVMKKLTSDNLSQPLQAKTFSQVLNVPDKMHKTSH